MSARLIASGPGPRVRLRRSRPRDPPRGERGALVGLRASSGAREEGQGGTTVRRIRGAPHARRFGPCAFAPTVRPEPRQRFEALSHGPPQPTPPEGDIRARQGREATAGPDPTRLVAPKPAAEDPEAPPLREAGSAPHQPSDQPCGRAFRPPSRAGLSSR